MKQECSHVCRPFISMYSDTHYMKIKTVINHSNMIRVFVYIENEQKYRC